MIINNSNIQYYLDKFFAGDTTCVEEKELNRYFLTTKNFPEGIERYKPMFQWIDMGMPDIEEFKKRGSFFQGSMVWVRWLAAAVVILSITLFNVFMIRSSSNRLESIYEGSYVCHNGVVNKDIKSIMPEIKSMLQQIDEMEKMAEHLDFDEFIIDID